MEIYFGLLSFEPLTALAVSSSRRPIPIEHWQRAAQECQPSHEIISLQKCNVGIEHVSMNDLCRLLAALSESDNVAKVYLGHAPDSDPKLGWHRVTPFTCNNSSGFMACECLQAGHFVKFRSATGYVNSITRQHGLDYFGNFTKYDPPYKIRAATLSHEDASTCASWWNARLPSIDELAATLGTYDPKTPVKFTEGTNGHCVHASGIRWHESVQEWSNDGSLIQHIVSKRDHSSHLRVWDANIEDPEDRTQTGLVATRLCWVGD